MQFEIHETDGRLRDKLSRSLEYRWDQLREIANATIHRPTSPSDIDGIWEINNHFLFLEYKQDNVDPPKGQAQMYGKLVRRIPGSCLFLISHRPTKCVCHYTDIICWQSLFNDPWDNALRLTTEMEAAKLIPALTAWLEFANSPALNTAFFYALRKYSQ